MAPAPTDAGAALAVPVCPVEPCRASHVDLQSGACVSEALADGTACEGGPCLTGGLCRAGVCTGVVPTCDDGDACTEDACDPARGCIHLGRSCPAPADPCAAAYCDPAQGCSSAPAPDGTRCGPSDCSAAHVCLAGACREVATPEGSECAPATPCQEHGTCQGGQCIQPPPHPLAPTSTLPPAPGYYILNPPLADADQNLYWTETEWAGNRQVLASATRDGLVRFRQDVPEHPRFFLVDQGLLIGKEVTFHELVAYRTTDGALVWRTHLADGRGDAPPVCGSGFQIERVVGAEGGAFEVVAHCGSPEEAQVIRISAAGGAVGWVAHLPGLSVLDVDFNYLPAFVMVDGRGVLRANASRSDLAIDPAGAVSVATDAGVLAPIARLGDEVLRLDLLRGELRNPAGNALSPSPNLSAVLGNATRGYGIDANRWDGTPPLVTAFDPGTMQVLWQRPEVMGWRGGPSEDGSLSFTEDLGLFYVGPSIDAGASKAARALDRDGNLRFACDLGSGPGGCPGCGPETGLLLDGRLVGWDFTPDWSGSYRLEFYDLPGVRPAASGWVTPSGNPGQSFRPR